MNIKSVSAVFALLFCPVLAIPLMALTLTGNHLTVTLAESGSVAHIFYNPTGNVLPTTPEGAPIHWGGFTMSGRGDFSMLSVLRYDEQQAYGGTLGNVYHGVTSETSSNRTLSASTVMNFSTLEDRDTLPLIITQDLSFDRDGKVIYFTMHFKNISDSFNLNMIYARAWNPIVTVHRLYDEGVEIHEGYGSKKTTNVTDDFSRILACPFEFRDVNAEFDWQAEFAVNSGNSLITIGNWAGPAAPFGDLYINPISIFSSISDGSLNFTNDYLTAFFDMGVLGPAETRSISFQYLFDGSAFDARTLPAPTRGTIVILGSTSIP